MGQGYAVGRVSLESAPAGCLDLIAPLRTTLYVVVGVDRVRDAQMIGLDLAAD